MKRRNFLAALPVGLSCLSGIGSRAEEDVPPDEYDPTKGPSYHMILLASERGGGVWLPARILSECFPEFKQMIVDLLDEQYWSTRLDNSDTRDNNRRINVRWQGEEVIIPKELLTDQSFNLLDMLASMVAERRANRKEPRKFNRLRGSLR